MKTQYILKHKLTNKEQIMNAEEKEKFYQYQNKYDYIESVKSDILIIQECEKLKQDCFPNAQYFWTGRDENKGLGVLVKKDTANISKLHNQNFIHFLPIETDDLNIREILNYMSVVDPKLNIEAQILATGKGSNWRLTVDKFIASVLEKLQPYSTFPILSAGHLNYPVLKKSGEPVSLIWRETFLRAVLDGALPPPLPEVLTELQLSSQSNHGLQITEK